MFFRYTVLMSKRLDELTQNHIYNEADLPTALQIVYPESKYFEDWWQRSFDPKQIHSLELKEILYKEWILLNQPPNLSYLALQSLPRQQRAVALARFVFVNKYLIDYVKSVKTGFLNQIIREHKIKNKPIFLDINTLNSNNEIDKGIGCVISAFDGYSDINPLHTQNYFMQIMTKFMIDTEGWQIRFIALTVSNQEAIKIFTNLGFECQHTINMEGRDHQILVVNKESASRSNSFLFPIFNPSLPLLDLSPRERQVLLLSLKKYTTNDIASILNVKSTSITYYKKQARKKFTKYTNSQDISEYKCLLEFVSNNTQEIRASTPNKTI